MYLDGAGDGSGLRERLPKSNITASLFGPCLLDPLVVSFGEMALSTQEAGGIVGVLHHPDKRCGRYRPAAGQRV